MRGTRTPRKVIVSTCSPNRVVGSDSQRSVWVVNDDGHPKSPLSIERLPRNVQTKISRVARVKPRCIAKETKVKQMPRKRRDPPEGSLPFFIDKSPSEELVGVKRNRRPSLMNESIIILDSPSVSSAPCELHLEGPVQEPLRQNSVDTVDLCSEEEEGVATTKGTKRKKRREATSRKRRKLCLKKKDDQQPDDQQPDVIVLDDEDECPGRSCNNTSVIESTQVKSSSNSKCNDHPRPTSSFSCFNETPTSATIASAGPSSGKNTHTRPTYLDKPLANSVPPHDNDIALSSNKNPGKTRNHYAEGNATKSNLSETVGSNVFNPCGNVKQTGLRPIIIDGCNVAIAHGGNRMFSVKGLCICVEYFLRRGHDQVVALVPLHLRSKVSPQDRDVMEALKDDNHLVFTPSRFINNRLISSYDDRYIVQYAVAVGGVIVSRDNYRDLLIENPAWRDTITNRLLMPTWVGDVLMFPMDPLGKRGPCLDEFLQFPNS